MGRRKDFYQQAKVYVASGKDQSFPIVQLCSCVLSDRCISLNNVTSSRNQIAFLRINADQVLFFKDTRTFFFLPVSGLTVRA